MDGGLIAALVILIACIISPKFLRLMLADTADSILGPKHEDSNGR